MKKIGLLVLVLAVVGAGVFAYRWYDRSKNDPYKTFIKPRVEMSSFQITNLTKEETKGTMKVLIDNAAPVGFKADSLSYQIYMAGAEVMRSTYPKPIKLEANDSSLISLPVTIDNQKMLAKLKEFKNEGTDSVEYTMKAQVHTDLPFFKNKPLNLTFSKKMPAYIIPDVRLVDTDLDKLGLNQTKMTAKVEIKNPNAFAYRFKQTTYRINLEGKAFAEGRIDTMINIPANGKTVLELPMEVTLKEGLKAGVKMLTKPEEVDYSFSFRTKLVDQKGNKTFQDSRMVMTGQGKMNELLDAAKAAAQGNKAEKEEKKAEEKAAKKAEREEKREEKKEARQEKKEDAKDGK
jgi:LEA14-like dessication related protein